MLGTSDEMFETMTDWRVHLLEERKDRPKMARPKICSMCTKVFQVTQAYNTHLHVKHRLKGSSSEIWRSLDIFIERAIHEIGGRQGEVIVQGHRNREVRY